MQLTLRGEGGADGIGRSRLANGASASSACRDQPELKHPEHTAEMTAQKKHDHDRA
jgi:hypothetical protein